MASEKRYHFAFSGKEIFFIFTLLMLISALLFSMGYIFGKSGGFNLSTLMSSKEASDLDEELGGGDELSEGAMDEGVDDLSDDDEIDDFEGNEAKTPASEASKTETTEPDKGKNAEKEGKLSFYQELNSESTIDKAPEKSESHSPMVSDEVLLSNRGKYTVQVAAFPNQLDAEQKMRELKSTCCPSAYYVQSEVANKGRFYQVRIGFFDKLSSAKKFGENLKKQDKIKNYILKIVR